VVNEKINVFYFTVDMNDILC